MSPKQTRLIPWRVAVVVGAVILLALASWWLITRGLGAMPTRCHFHHFTGLHCPGCGMTRATDAIFHGHILTAIGYNPLGVIMLPIAIVGLLLETYGWLRATPPPWRIPLGKHGAKIIAGAFILFTILRNLPWGPLSWLAP